MKPYLDSLLHALGGFAGSAFVAGLFISGTLVWWVSVGAFVLWSAFGLIREWFQHDDDTPVWNTHRIIEGLAWGVGAALGGLL